MTPEPCNAPAWLKLANALQQSGQSSAAIDAYRQVIALDPQHIGAHGMLARLLHHRGDVEQSLPHFQALTRLLPQNPDVWHALGVALHDMGRLDDAQRAYQSALEINPAHSQASYALGLIDLTRGDFEPGWKGFESRQGIRTYPAPIWDGSDLSGRSILLHAEQGLGDTLQFIRYAPMVAARGGKVLVSCPPPLVRLLAENFGPHAIFPDGAPLPPFDVHCPLLSLPALFGTKLQTIPATLPYLHPDQAAIARWSATLAPFCGRRRRIGLAWAGNPAHRNDRNRSIPPTALEFLATIPHGVLVNLQKGGPAPSSVLRYSMIDHTADLTDMAETAALLANLDLVITVDTSIAHLAGALAKPTWLLLPHVADWRWLLDRTDSPWYPTMRLYRQTVAGDWTDPVARIQRDLQSPVVAPPQPT